MSKRKNESQFDLDLVAKAISPSFQQSDDMPRVLPFIDAATLQVRQDAIRRVAANGIFAVHGLRPK